MRKRIFPLTVLLLLIFTVSAQATVLRAASANPILKFDGTTAVCSVNYRAANSKDQVKVTLTLYQGNTYVDSWSDSGTYRVSLSGECAVKSGKSYKLVMTHSVNGITKPAVTVSNTCP